MEVTGVVLRKSFPICFSSSSTSASNELQASSASVVMRRHRRHSSGGRIVLSTGFYDQSHLKYYNSNPTAIMRSEKVDQVTKEKGLKKMKKNKMKLLKGLSRDLSSFSQIGFGLDSDRALVDKVKGNMISDAAELLLEQLQKLRAEEKELKKKKKEEKARLKAVQLQNRHMKCESSSSSSSSESSSSDSECEVVDMKSLKHAQANKNRPQPVIGATISPPTISLPVFAGPPISLPTSPSTSIVSLPVLASPEEEITISSERACCSGNGISVNLCNESRDGSDTITFSKKIEVCMGGKCKKSGAAALVEEFQRVVGIEGVVSGCKCMGKCRDGPNVRVNVVDGGVADPSVGSSSNPLCIGVGLEDVDMIVASFLGENQNQLGFAA